MLARLPLDPPAAATAMPSLGHKRCQILCRRWCARAAGSPVVSCVLQWKHESSPGSVSCSQPRHNSSASSASGRLAMSCAVAAMANRRGRVCDRLWHRQLWSWPLGAVYTLSPYAAIVTRPTPKNQKAGLRDHTEVTKRIQSPEAPEHRQMLLETQRLKRKAKGAATMTETPGAQTGLIFRFPGPLLGSVASTLDETGLGHELQYPPTKSRIRCSPPVMAAASAARIRDRLNGLPRPWTRPQGHTLPACQGVPTCRLPGASRRSHQLDCLSKEPSTGLECDRGCAPIHHHSTHTDNPIGQLSAEPSRTQSGGMRRVRKNTDRAPSAPCTHPMLSKMRAICCSRTMPAMRAARPTSRAAVTGAVHQCL